MVKIKKVIKDLKIEKNVVFVIAANRWSGVNANRPDWVAVVKIKKVIKDLKIEKNVVFVIAANRWSG
ncbi:hypothetical protein, partial [Salmonella enterica]|uniref:hypothetical protein n=1 Tax=Salmonella enterica TaxID=28901 RepID=UPI002FCDBDD9